jgi:hypothetical protein
MAKGPGLPKPLGAVGGIIPQPKMMLPNRVGRGLKPHLARPVRTPRPTVGRRDYAKAELASEGTAGDGTGIGFGDTGNTGES